MAKKGKSFYQIICEYKSMSANGSKLPVYHLKCIGPESQGRGATKEEAPTQINDIRQHGILYQNACEWQ